MLERRKERLKMDLLDAAQVEMLIQSADKKREKYVNSEKYVPEMCSVLLQNWNMIGNDIFLRRNPVQARRLNL